MEEAKPHQVSIFNTHIHTFTFNDIPKKFIPLGLVRLLSHLSVRIARFLNNLLKRTEGDVYDRYANFIRLITCRKQIEIFKYIRQFYPEHTLTRFIVLSMDMAFMKAGEVKNQYENQLIELSQLSTKVKEDEFTEIYPFICVDPRREGVLDLVKKYVTDYGFCGIKLYPPLGYFPYDKRLDSIYAFANEKKLPIIAHCSKSGPVFFREKKKKIRKQLIEEINPNVGLNLDFNKKNKRELCNYFTHPKNYEKILTKYPNLKICLAHFGGGTQWEKFLNPSTDGICKEKKNKKIDTEASWFEIIYDMLKSHKNLYTDISYNLSRIEYLSILKMTLLNKEIQNQILYGTDFYMSEVESSDRRFGFDIRGYIGEDNFKLIATTNPKEFLDL
ncbi:MAG: amidohydrolase family protein [Candidatus Heimdallarchaeota archaeon]|nr:amidohydrolase family protein [Candidatus Heimdallarchaeota archaeon]